MNWSLLFLILKFLAISWAKPIVPSETYNEFQTDKENLHNLSNQTFTLADETINLNRTWDNLLNSTKDALSTSSLNKIGENVEKASEDLKNFMAVVQKELNNYVEHEPADGESDIQVLIEATTPQGISNKAEDSHITTQIPTEPINDLKANATSSNNNEYHSLVDPSNSSQHIFSTTTFSLDPAVTEMGHNLEISSNDSTVAVVNEDTDKDFSGSAKNEESIKRLVRVPENEIILKSISKTEESSDVSTVLNTTDAEKATEKIEIITEQAATTQEIETQTIVPNTQSSSGNLHEDLVNLLNKTDRKIEKELETNYTPATTINSPDSGILNNFETSVQDFVPITKNEKLFTRSSSPVENFDVFANQSSESDNNVQKQTTPEGKITEYQERSSGEITDLKQSVDVLINQVSGIEQNIDKIAEETVQNSSIMQPVTENGNEPDTTKLNDLKSKETSEQAPTFKQAVDSFIEDVLDIGSKLKLIPEKTPDEQAQMATTQTLTENATEEDNSFIGDKLLIAANKMPVMYPEAATKMAEISENLDSTADNTTETITTTESFLENLKEIKNNNQEEAINFESIDFSTTYENLKGITVTDIEKSTSDLFSKNATKSEDVIESLRENTTERKSDEQLSQLENLNFNFEASSIEAPMEDFHEATTTTLNEYNQKYEVPTTQTPNGSVQITEEIVKSLKENINHEKIFSKGNYENINEQSVKEVPSKHEVHLNKRAEITAHEYETNSSGTTQHPEIVTNFEKVLLNDQSIVSDLELLESQETNKSAEIKEAKNENLSSHYNVENEITKIKNEATTTTTLEENDQKYEVPSTQTPNRSEQIPEEIVKNFNENVDINHDEVFSIANYENINEPNVKRVPLMHEVHLDKRAEITAHEYQTNSTNTTQQPEIVRNFETNLLNGKTIEVVESQETPEIISVNLSSHYNTEQEMTTNNQDSNENPATTQDLNTTEDYNTLSPIAQKTSTKANTQTEETTNSLNKFENSFKTFTEKENVKREEKVSTTPENATLTPSTSSPTSITLSIKFTTLSPLETTKASAEKLEEKLQEAVKVLADEMKKLTVWEAEHESIEEEATTFRTNLNETTTLTVNTPQPLGDPFTNTKSDDETSAASNILEQPHSSGLIRKKFADKFSDYYEDKAIDSTTVSQQEKQMDNFEQITESPLVTSTLVPYVEKIEIFTEDETTTFRNEIKENVVTTTADDRATEESTNRDEAATTEYIPTTTTEAMLSRVSLQRDTNSVSLHTDIIPAVEVSTQKLLNETHTELITTMQPTETIEEANTQPSSDSFLHEHTDITASRQSFKEADQEPLATSQTTQRPLMQSSFMDEKQQQVESTTENDAQTQSVATSGQITDSTVNPEETAQQQTTEAEIYLTTEQEAKEEETTDAPQEPEAARSLSLPPPKLEYSQNEDGVEVFYGYSNVKHN